MEGIAGTNVRTSHDVASMLAVSMRSEQELIQMRRFMQSIAVGTIGDADNDGVDDAFDLFPDDPNQAEDVRDSLDSGINTDQVESISDAGGWLETLKTELAPQITAESMQSTFDIDLPGYGNVYFQLSTLPSENMINSEPLPLIKDADWIPVLVHAWLTVSVTIMFVVALMSRIQLA